MDRQVAPSQGDQEGWGRARWSCGQPSGRVERQGEPLEGPRARKPSQSKIQGAPELERQEGMCCWAVVTQFQPFAHPVWNKMLLCWQTSDFHHPPQQTKRGRRCSSRLKVQWTGSRCWPTDRGPAEMKIWMKVRVKFLFVIITREALNSKKRENSGIFLIF